MLLIVGFFFIAVLYSTVGFAGGSSYTALLALPYFAVPFSWIPLLSLSCNVVVSGKSFFSFRKNNLIEKWVYPYLILSVIASFLGALIPLEEKFFFLMISLMLMIAGAVILLEKKWLMERPAPTSVFRLKSRKVVPVIFSLVGFLSGLSGIGGGIYLSPLLHFFKFTTSLKIASLCSVFIFFNSIFGVLGQIVKKNQQATLSSFVSSFEPIWLFLLVSVFLGGVVGNHLTLKKLSLLKIKQLTGLLILLVGVVIGIRNY